MRYKAVLRQKIALLSLGLILAACIIEIALRAAGFIYQSMGERQNRISPNKNGQFRILCLGGSTTALGGRYSYPSHLEEILNKHNIGINFKVVNKGVCGITTMDIVRQIEFNLDRYRPDLVITMIGINDDRQLYYDAIGASNRLRFIRSLRIYKFAWFVYLRIKTKITKLKKYFSPASVVFADNAPSEESLKKLIESEPRNRSLYSDLGWHYLGRGNLVEAEEAFNKAVKLEPRNGNLYYDLAVCYINMEKSTLAETSYKKALALGVDPIPIKIDLGFYYLKIGKNIEAENIFKRTIALYPENDFVCGAAGMFYNEIGKHEKSEYYFKKANNLRMKYYNPERRRNHRKIKEILNARKIKFVCVQYPVRGIEPLKKRLAGYDDILFIDNEKIFKEKLKKASYSRYFIDLFGGDFGHCTPEGNLLLADNIAKGILKEYFNQ